jgi:hypothetical protein
MWQCLNTYASAIQAVSAVVGVAATVVLVWITARYVPLTKVLADAATAQLQAQSAEARAKRRELEADVNILGLALKSLPDASRQASADQVIRDSITTDGFDFGRFRTLAAERGPQVGNYAAVVESKMKWLGDRVKAVKNTPYLTGYDWRSFDWKSWNGAINEVREALTLISTEAEEG